MSLTLVYIGAAAGLAPAASLQALAVGGTVLIPSGLEPDLDRLLREAVGTGGGACVTFDAREAGSAGLSTGSDAIVALAGRHAASLARDLRARHAVPQTTVPAGSAFDDALLGQELVSLKRIVDVLRVECPWDREQTPRDIVAYTVEEVYELADAVAGDHLDHVHGELGDLLLQVVLLALMMSERGAGDLASVSAAIEEKLIRRHPHIFADAVADTPAEVKSRWERIKVEQEGRQGIFHDVPASFPALLLARKLQQRAGSAGFDWDSAREGFHKIAEEHGELAELFDETPVGDPDRHDPRVTHEVGDLLFAVVNVARLLHVDPELSLREAARRFERRVLAAAELAAAEGLDWAALDLPGQEDYYQRAKAGGVT